MEQKQPQTSLLYQNKLRDVSGLLVSPLRDGRPLNDNEIAGMLIGLLLAGQHTSSTTSAWMGFFMAKDKALQERCYAEQKAVCGPDLPALTFDQVSPSQPADCVPLYLFTTTSTLLTDCSLKLLFMINLLV